MLPSLGWVAGFKHSLARVPTGSLKWVPKPTYYRRSRGGGRATLVGRASLKHDSIDRSGVGPPKRAIFKAPERVSPSPPGVGGRLWWAGPSLVVDSSMTLPPIHIHHHHNNQNTHTTNQRHPLIAVEAPYDNLEKNTMADLHNLLQELEADNLECLSRRRRRRGSWWETRKNDRSSVGRNGRNRTFVGENSRKVDLLPATVDGASSSRRFLAVPVALQEAKRHREQEEPQEHKKTLTTCQSSSSSLYFKKGRDNMGLLFDDEEEGAAVNEWYIKLHQLWHQEQHCPEILEYDSAVVEEIKAQMVERQEWIDTVGMMTTSQR